MKQFANYSILFLILFCTIIAYVVKGKVETPKVNEKSLRQTLEYEMAIGSRDVIIKHLREETVDLLVEIETLKYQLNQCKILLRGPN